ncbi:hypothetical protein K438DRAFT_2016540 [Mycena galopus ATCC 62051]|nr:hypothetical protein K438DRAFT_2016540 [Mycena galopus ATCC 62051]
MATLTLVQDSPERSSLTLPPQWSATILTAFVSTRAGISISHDGVDIPYTPPAARGLRISRPAVYHAVSQQENIIIAIFRRQAAQGVQEVVEPGATFNKYEAPQTDQNCRVFYLYFGDGNAVRTSCVVVHAFRNAKAIEAAIQAVNEVQEQYVLEAAQAFE